MKRITSSSLIVIGIMLALIQPVSAHFQVLIPSADIVTAAGNRTVDFTIVFTHPMEQGPVMNMEMPAQFGVMIMGQKKDLKDSLEVKEIDGNQTYHASYTLKQPGDHIFYLEPAPYWEPAEEVMIVHYTKVIVNGMSAEEGWDTLVGFPVEIEPLVRPYGLWTGNVFRGIVKKDGNPVPFAEIEVEYYNEGGQVAIPADPFITQVIKADANGVFTYAMPKAGWWAFAALLEGDNTMQSPDGNEVGVELGALMWVNTTDMDLTQ
ncbi:DUF4198 domain-containing protein [candidate division KSB3 bacterium]|uniref:DUF4198 domain-containing protein n=1 Tax=candidate division KSB3 bacterium TaxID=2044937 RepID=A0A9D5Q5C3_9BACT|nr:DUF4198 domain-containing protein [candidate division KSB3 bacterium]MBD3324465.1 DUF4198 domain-containing protein [candidate division KSB3 bacterium]